MHAKFSHFENNYCKIEKFQIGKKWYFWNPEPIYWFDVDGKRHVIRAGFISDGFSVPPYLWPIIHLLVNVLAAHKHDEDYLLGYPQKEADEDLRLAIIATHQPECWWPWWRRKIYSARIRYNALKVWLGVYIGGASAWRHYAAQRKAGIDVTTNRYADSLEEAKEKAGRL